jgi:hypothetical protein
MLLQLLLTLVLFGGGTMDPNGVVVSDGVLLGDGVLIGDNWIVPPEPPPQKDPPK